MEIITQLLKKRIGEKLGRNNVPWVHKVILKESTFHFQWRQARGVVCVSTREAPPGAHADRSNTLFWTPGTLTGPFQASSQKGSIPFTFWALTYSATTLLNNPSLTRHGLPITSLSANQDSFHCSSKEITLGLEIENPVYPRRNAAESQKGCLSINFQFLVTRK